MSMVEMIERLPKDTVTVDDNFKKLQNALDEYHRLIQDGVLIPRKNNVQDIYTVHSINSNVR